MTYAPPPEFRISLPAEGADPARCLGPAFAVDSDHPALVARAREITRHATTDWERASALFAHVRDTIAYDFTPDLRSPDDWRASNTLARGTGFCQQKAVLLTALGRAAGIPSATGLQHILDHKLLDTRYEAWLPAGIIQFHGHSCFFLDGAWRIADATLDSALSVRREYRLVELSQTAPDAARLPRTDLAGAPHFDFLAEFGPFPEIPGPVVDLLVSLRPRWQALMQLARKTGATM
jgi:hypothetical protein